MFVLGEDGTLAGFRGEKVFYGIIVCLGNKRSSSVLLIIISVGKRCCNLIQLAGIPNPNKGAERVRFRILQVCTGRELDVT